MTVIYIDRVFALNLALDYMLLLICARLAGTPLRRLRFLLCAAGGAAPALYTGCDSQILPSLSLGGAGVISVLSNLFPRETGEICRLFFAGRTEDSRTLFLRYLPLMRLLFAETNPAPLKCALAHARQCREEMRLPLYPVPRALRERLHREMEALSQEKS